MTQGASLGCGFGKRGPWRVSFINFAAREINCKIVYYGAGLGGKTTNLQFIFQKTAEQQKGKMISLGTETDRTLFFDFLPLDLGTVRGFKTRIHLYTRLEAPHCTQIQRQEIEKQG